MKTSKHPMLIGDRYGRIVVINLLTENYKNDKYVVGQCECGTIKTFAAGNLRNKTTTSCGCFRKELHQLRTRKSPGEAMINKWEKTYKEGAFKRDLNFDLTKDEFKKLIQSNCHYCNEPPKFRNHYYNKNNQRTGNMQISEEWAQKSGTYLNGVDRLDNNNGYTLTNSVSCCSICNFMKRTFGTQEFLEHINKIYNFQKEKHESSSQK